MKTLITVMLLGASTLSNAQPLSCFRQARDTTYLTDQQALSLCCRRDDTGPVDCFNEARLQRQLSFSDALRLCTCAADVGPVACLNTARDTTLLNKETAINECIGKTQFSYLPGVLAPPRSSR